MAHGITCLGIQRWAHLHVGFDHICWLSGKRSQNTSHHTAAKINQWGNGGRADFWVREHINNQWTINRLHHIDNPSEAHPVVKPSWPGYKTWRRCQRMGHLWAELLWGQSKGPWDLHSDTHFWELQLHLCNCTSRSEIKQARGNKHSSKHAFSMYMQLLGKTPHLKTSLYDCEG